MKGIAWIGFLLGVVLCDEIKEANPGLGLAFNSSFVRKTVDIVVPIVLKELKGLNINSSGSMNLSLFLFNYTLDHFKVNEVNLDYAHTGIDMSKGMINYTMSNFSLDLDAALEFTTDPVLFFGKGTGMFKMSELSNVLAINFDLGKNQLPLLRLIRSFAHLKNDTIKAKFEGTNDVFTLMDMVQGFAIPLIVNFTGGEMTKDSMKTIESTVNGLIEGLPHKLQVPNTNLELDYGFLLAPSADENYLPLSLNGTTICANQSACRKYNGDWPTPPKKIDVFGGNGSLQLILSDYMLNTAMISLYQDNKLTIWITPDTVRDLTNGSFALNTDFIGVFIPIIRDTYGQHRDAYIKLNVTQPPNIHISKSKMTIDMVSMIDIYVNNSLNNEIEKVLGVETTFKFGLLLHMSKNYLKGKITDYEFSLKIKFKSIEEISIDDVQRMFNLIFKLAIPQVNSLLHDGILLPSLGPFFSLKTSELTMLDQYIRFDFNPEPVKEAFEEYIPLLIQQISNSLLSPKPSQESEIEKKPEPINLPEWLQVTQ